MNRDMILQTKGLGKYFHEPQKFKVLDDISFEVGKGEFLTIVGKSGCGKSTMLYCLSTMDTNYEGDLYIANEKATGKSTDKLATLRNENIGFVFQFHYLLNEFNVLKNVMLPGLKLGKYSIEEIEHRAVEKLKILGIHNEANKKPNQLSGGQKQRVAIARALINNPILIMGDEPTGNLDKKNSDIVFDIFNHLSSEFNQTLLIVTHDNDFANRTNRIIEMEDGRILNSV
jgi:lipoprotein-releasing system ATP-binding protein